MPFAPCSAFGARTCGVLFLLAPLEQTRFISMSTRCLKQCLKRLCKLRSLSHSVPIPPPPHTHHDAYLWMRPMGGVYVFVIGL